MADSSPAPQAVASDPPPPAAPAPLPYTARALGAGASALGATGAGQTIEWLVQSLNLKIPENVAMYLASLAAASIAPILHAYISRWQNKARGG
jgi:hypothetical protein